MPKRLSVAVSQGQSQNPVRRELEEELVAALMMEPGIDVAVIPHLYDLTPESTGVLALQGISNDLVVVSWLYERAARWTLDRNNVRGEAGVCQLIRDDGEDDEDEEEGDSDEDKRRVIEDRETPKRNIYCLDFSAAQSVEDFVVEVRRIRNELTTEVVELASWIKGTPNQDQLQRFASPANDTALGPSSDSSGDHQQATEVDETPDRRWYPVIDFGRCTNCMECIDFCLFGVYGIDQAETILVEQPDNCRKGCPACSRVCPENAIIFPQHKTPAIAGAPVQASAFKIDLSRLFGAPDALEVAARERDEQLVMVGRDAVGLEVGIPKRQSGSSEQRDDLDDLIDGLDDFDI